VQGMGWLFFGNYNKPGKGVSKDEPKKKGLMLFFSIFYRKFWKLLQLSALFTFFCIPVVTIGPATAALSFVVRNYSKEEHSWVFSDFFEQFVLNFKQGFLFGILDIVIYFALIFSYFFYSQLRGFLSIFAVFIVLITIIFTMMRFYIYPMIVTFKLNSFAIYKNAFIFAAANFFKNLYVIFLCLIYLTICYCIALFLVRIDILALIVLPFFTSAFIGLLVSVYAYPILKKHMIDPQESD
jgi:uncharacterized membrane protein YesL